MKKRAQLFIFTDEFKKKIFRDNKLIPSFIFFSLCCKNLLPLFPRYLEAISYTITIIHKIGK